MATYLFGIHMYLSIVPFRFGSVVRLSGRVNIVDYIIDRLANCADQNEVHKIYNKRSEGLLSRIVWR